MVAVTVTADAQAAPATAFAVIAPIDLPTIFTGSGPLPAVVRVRGQTGAWDHVGARRIVEFADGSEAREELTGYEPPGRFAYRVGPFTGPLRLLVAHADGTWLFARTRTGSVVCWTYAFRPRPLARPLVRWVVAPLWRRYARRALALAVAEAEAEAESRTAILGR